MIVVAASLVALAVGLLVAELRGRSRRRETFEDPLELSTLTFPPGSLGRSSRKD